MKYLSILSLFVFSCSEDKITSDNKIDEQEPFEKYSFIDNYKKLDDETTLKMSSIIFPFYSNNPSDTIIEIYNIEANLYDEHYTTKENDLYEKYAFFVKREDKKVDTLFFGIFKSTSDFMFFNYLKKFKILTVDFHFKYEYDFSFLTKKGFGTIVSIDNLPEKGVSRQNISFSHNSERIWKVDSIIYKNEKNSFFNEIDSFYIEENKNVFSKNNNKLILSYYIENYTMFIKNDKDFLEHWIVSYSNNYRILHDENQNFIFISNKFI